MQKIKVFLITTAVMLLIGTFGVTAQSMEVIDDLLAAETADYGASVYMIAVGSGLADETASISEAVDVISKKGWNFWRKGAGDPINLGELSFLTMKSLNMSGGLMYMLFPSERYAVRELAFLGLIDGEAHPDRKISGEEVLNILSQAIAMKEAN